MAVASIKPQANVQNTFIAKLNPQQENQLAHSIQKQKVKEMSLKKNFWMRNSRIVFANSCPGLVSSGISLISQKALLMKQQILTTWLGKQYCIYADRLHVPLQQACITMKNM